MKRNCCILAAALLVAPIVAAPFVSGGDKQAVERAVLDYVEGIYEVKPELIERSVHPELNKFGFARRSAEDEYRRVPMTFPQLVALAGNYNKQGRVPKDAPKKVELLDVLNQTASAKLTASWGIDYMHLAKYDGKWKIVHVLWQTAPEKTD